MQHPCGVLPASALISGAGLVRTRGLGRLACLGDELILEILGSLPPSDLSRSAAVSKALYCFCYHEDLWRGKTLKDFEGDFQWKGSWRHTYLAKVLPEGRFSLQTTPRSMGLCSDLLYQPWLLANLEIPTEWLEVENIDRVSGLSAAEFRTRYELPGRPVVLSDGATSWPALRRWSPAYLRHAYGPRTARVGGYDMRLEDFQRYARRCADDMPLYLFDPQLHAAAPSLMKDFAVPTQFEEDLFALLGGRRPDYRWLIAGPARSGSSFHVDPNATSAWNAVISGRKKWVMFPPGVTPPGVHPSADGADVAAPLSLIEWFLNFYGAARAAKVKPLEAVVGPGEVLFVPTGWWHLALNVEACVAVTQNYVSAANLPAVLRFLATRRSELVSGCAPGERSLLYRRFMRALRRHRPDLLEELDRQGRAAAAAAAQSRALSAIFRSAAPLAPPAKDERAAAVRQHKRRRRTGAVADRMQRRH